jgi:hypothetical protein
LNCNGQVSAFSNNEQAIPLKVIDPEQSNLHQSFLSAKNSGYKIFWHDKTSLPLDLLSDNGKSRKKYFLVVKENIKYCFLLTMTSLTTVHQGSFIKIAGEIIMSNLNSTYLLQVCKNQGKR